MKDQTDRAILSMLFFGLLFAASTCGYGQRHSGDAHSVGGARADPILNIDDRPAHTWIYPRLSNLTRMKATFVQAPDPLTGKISIFKGVPVRDLVPFSAAHVLAIYQSGMFRDKLVADSRCLDLDNPIIVAYEENGHLLRGKPFWFVAKQTNGTWIIVDQLAYLRAE